VIEAAKERRDVVKAAAARASAFAPSPGSSTQRGGRTLPTLFALILSGAAVASSTGCAAVLGGGATTRPALMSPIVRVYVARQVYAAALPALTSAIDARMFDASPDVLRAIAATRRTLDRALDEAESYADAGRETDFLFWIAQADTALAEFLKLSRPGQRAIPFPSPTTTRPTGAAPTAQPESETWTLLRSPHCSRVSPSWALPSPTRLTRPDAAKRLPTPKSRPSAPPNRWLALTITGRSTTL
jgi:hypothetical protein